LGLEIAGGAVMNTDKRKQQQGQQKRKTVHVGDGVADDFGIAKHCLRVRIDDMKIGNRESTR
jgi:hypothetical protein